MANNNNNLITQGFPRDDPCAQLRRQREAALGEAAVEAEYDADGLGPHGFTFNNLDEALVKRIDFVLSRPGPAANGSVLCPLAMRHRGHRTAAGFSPSDHLAVIVDYAVVRSAGGSRVSSRQQRGHDEL